MSVSLWIRGEPKAIPLCVHRCVFDYIQDHVDPSKRESARVFAEGFAGQGTKITEVLRMDREQVVAELAEMAYMNKITLDDLAGELVMLELIGDPQIDTTVDQYYLQTKRIQ